MKLVSYGALFIAITCEIIATSALKQTQEFTRLVPSLICLAGYAAAFYSLSIALRSIPIGIAYAIWSGAGIVLISIIGMVFFKQYLDLAACIGLALIIAGVIIIHVFSKSVMN